jgi:putative oxidoreductase
MKAVRDLGILAVRLILGGYLVAHGAQKLLGTFDGPGLKRTSKQFELMGLRPGVVLATAASVSEVGGGLLTAAGAWSPLGPIMLAETMAVATASHRAKGPFAARGGYELALTNLGAALLLAITGPGRLSSDHLFGSRLPRWKSWLAAVSGLAAAGGSIRMLLGASSSSTVTATTAAQGAAEAPAA